MPSSKVQSHRTMEINSIDERHIKVKGDLLDFEVALFNQLASTPMVGVMPKPTKTSDDKHKEVLAPVPDKKGYYATSPSARNDDFDKSIAFETHVKVIGRWLSEKPPLLKLFFSWLFIKKLGMKLAYHDIPSKGPEREKAINELYAETEVLTHAVAEAWQEPKEIDSTAKVVGSSSVGSSPRTQPPLKIQNLGHAAQLIQTSDMRILVDPVFGRLNPFLYPSRTEPFKRDIKLKQLFKSDPIDVILISHNHRDHVDAGALKALVKYYKKHKIPLPEVFVPVGDKALFISFGFTSVTETPWNTSITVSKKDPQNPDAEPKKVTFCGVPADHRARRGAFDAHKSTVMGWTISADQGKEVLYVAGDTARLSDERITALAMNICALIQKKKDGILAPDELPQLINLEPGGPNYTRREMKPTHQSAVDSLISSFRLAIELSKISGKPAVDWLATTATVFMHHNRYELGPDRLHENLYIFNRLMSYLDFDDDELASALEKQQRKSSKWTLFHRRKDFIIEGVKELDALAKQIWSDEKDKVADPVDEETVKAEDLAKKQERRQWIKDFLNARTHMPKINSIASSDELLSSKLGERSHLRPTIWKNDDEKSGLEKGAKKRSFKL